MSRKAEVKSKIYRCLKTGPKTLDEIQNAIGTKYAKKEIAQYMDAMIKDRWVERHAGIYLLKYELHPPVPVDERDYPKYWDYERLQEVQGQVKPKPEAWMNPFLDFLFMCNWYEDVPSYSWRGTDWGSAGRYLIWLKQLELADPLPQEDKIQDFLNNSSFEFNESYAEIRSFEGLKDAIYNYHSVIVNLNFYDNLEQNYKRGEIPEPVRGAARPIGSCPVCAVGYSKDEIYFLNPFWRRTSSFSWRYYESSAGKAFTMIDELDAAVAKDIYGSIVVTTNVPCEIWIGRIIHDYHVKVGTGAEVAAELGRSYRVIAMPLVPTVETDQSHMVMPTREKPDIDCNFIFTPAEKKPFDKIREAIYNYLNK